MTTPSKTFRQLHDGPDVLLLANCWDAGSARLIEHVGARALATTSAGLAWSLGYPDGDALPVGELVGAVRAITRAVAIPLSIDVEAGYSDDPAVVGETMAAVIDAGAVGINLEDAAGSPELFAEKVVSIKKAASRAGVDLFVNARTDVYLRGLAPEAERVAETLRRARLYKDAGADGFFVPKVVQPEDIRAIASSAGMPLNVLAWPGLPAFVDLAALGVRRLSAGSAISLHALGRTAASARAFLRDGALDQGPEERLTYGEVNALFSAKAR